MAEISSSKWTELDSGNTSSAPDGWASGMQPNQVEPTGRQMMGATKRFWDRANPANTTTGSSGTYVVTLANVSFPTAYVQGETFWAKAHQDAVGGDTFAVNSLSALGLYKVGTSGIVAIVADDIRNGQFFSATYDGALNSSAGGFQIGFPASLAAAGEILASQTANTVLAAPDGSAGVPTFRALVSDDISLAFSNITGSIAGSQLPSYSDKTLVSNITGSSGTPSGNTLTAILDDIFGSTQGMILYRGASAWAALSAAAATGALLKSAGASANPSWQAKAFRGVFYPSDPTAITSTGGAMAGLGSTVAFTPAASGDVLITFQFTTVNPNNSSFANVSSLRYGTGTAPANADALTGTKIAQLTVAPPTGGGQAAANAPTTLTALVTGLTPGTAYWADLGLTPSGGAYHAASIVASVIELP